MGMETTTHYAFRVMSEDNDLIYPRSDRHQYENPMDLYWQTPELAIEFLKEEDETVQEAIADKWILVKVVTEVITDDIAFGMRVFGEKEQE
jgi:hypothetical protein